jgi:hypothetical protein
MKWLRYLNPRSIHDNFQAFWRVAGDGGPRAVYITDVRGPEGWIVPSATVDLEVVSRRHGRVVRFQPQLPVPWPLALAARAARQLLP